MVTDRHALNHDLKPSSPILDLILILANYNRNHSKKKYFKAIIPIIPLMACIVLFSAFSHLAVLLG